MEVDFGGGYLSSDGGGLVLRELERHNGLLRDLSPIPEVEAVNTR